ncbi:hypothetical protein EVAR_70460_1, partial [Eumeta japonica]
MAISCAWPSNQIKTMGVGGPRLLLKGTTLPTVVEVLIRLQHG